VTTFMPHPVPVDRLDRIHGQLYPRTLSTPYPQPPAGQGRRRQGPARVTPAVFLKGLLPATRRGRHAEVTR
jgi:hypothetical protein